MFKIMALSIRLSNPPYHSSSLLFCNCNASLSLSLSLCVCAHACMRAHGHTHARLHVKIQTHLLCKEMTRNLRRVKLKPFQQVINYTTITVQGNSLHFIKMSNRSPAKSNLTSHNTNYTHTVQMTDKAISNLQSSSRPAQTAVDLHRSD